MAIIDRYPTYKGGKVTEVVVYANYIGLCRFYRYVINISRWSPYEGGQLDRFYCIEKSQCESVYWDDVVSPTPQTQSRKLSVRPFVWQLI